MKKHAEYLMFAGTSEGRQLAEFLQEHQIPCSGLRGDRHMAKNCLRADGGDPGSYRQNGRSTEMENYIQELIRSAFAGSNRCHASTCGGSDEKYSELPCENTGMRYVRLLGVGRLIYQHLIRSGDH